MAATDRGQLVQARVTLERPLAAQLLTKRLGDLDGGAIVALAGRVEAADHLLTLGANTGTALSVATATRRFYASRGSHLARVLRRPRGAFSTVVLSRYRAALGRLRARSVRFTVVSGRFSRRWLTQQRERGAVVVTEGARERLARSKPNARAAAVPADKEDYMPRLWFAQTDLIPPNPDNDTEPGPSGDYNKMTSITIEWDDADNLAWYQGASAGDRGFEVEAYPQSESSLWSYWWDDEDEGDGWASDLPNAYLDDLSSDDVPIFAVGTADPTAIEVGEQYFVSFDTDEGTTDSGTVVLDGQATEREDTNPYCFTHFGSDRACYFARDTTPVGTYSVGGWGDQRIVWGRCPWPYDPDPYTFDPLKGVCHFNT